MYLSLPSERFGGLFSYYFESDGHFVLFTQTDLGCVSTQSFHLTFYDVDLTTIYFDIYCFLDSLSYMVCSYATEYLVSSTYLGTDCQL